MAKAIDEKELAKELKKHDSALLKKVASQAEQGKDFVLDDKGYGPGVIHESVWKKHKKGAEGYVADYESYEEGES